MNFVKLLIAWALAMVIYAVIVETWSVANRRSSYSFLGAIGGLGLLLAIPSLLFALIVGWPTMSWLAGLRPAWLVPAVAAATFALLMWLLTKLMLPSGWRGAGQALVGYAAVLGAIWASIALFSTFDGQA